MTPSLNTVISYIAERTVCQQDNTDMTDMSDSLWLADKTSV